MKSLMLMALLCSSAFATQESLMRFTAPKGTVSDYKSETSLDIKSTLVSLKSLDGKGLPQGLKEFVFENVSNKSLVNAEYRETVLEQDPTTGARIKHTGWNRSSTGLLLGPRIGLDYTLHISAQGQVKAQNIITKIIERGALYDNLTSSSQGSNLDKGLLEGQKISAFYDALWTQTMLQPFELGGRQPLRATSEQLGQEATSQGPQNIKLGEVKLLERTQSGGFRFAVDVDTARYAPELLAQTDSSYRVKQFSRQTLEYGLDGRLIRSSGTSTSVLQRPTETREFRGRKFEVVTALVTTSSTTTVRSDADDKTP